MTLGLNSANKYEYSKNLKTLTFKNKTNLRKKKFTFDSFNSKNKQFKIKCISQEGFSLFDFMFKRFTIDIDSWLCTLFMYESGVEMEGYNSNSISDTYRAFTYNTNFIGLFACVYTS